MEKSKDLCGNCGMCCDGTLFPFFRINPEESHLFPSDKTHVINIAQRCMHFDGCNGCKIYSKRPETCSSYKCPVLNLYESGSITFEEAETYISVVKENPTSDINKTHFITGHNVKDIKDHK